MAGNGVLLFYMLLDEPSIGIPGEELPAPSSKVVVWVLGADGSTHVVQTEVAANFQEAMVTLFLKMELVPKEGLLRGQMRSEDQVAELHEMLKLRTPEEEYQPDDAVPRHDLHIHNKRYTHSYMDTYIHTCMHT